MPEPGELIGPYRLVSQLGRGAMGEVWRARDERLDRYVALKVLPADLAGDVERRARMLREARAAAAIRHANVVTLFDVVSHRGDDILVMELVEGRTLSDAIRKDGPPPLATALRWIEGIADALVAAHARGVLHRDIKAANVMVTGETVKVLDFGLAKLARDGDAPLPRAPAASPPSASLTRIALDETMASEPRPGATAELALGETTRPAAAAAGSDPDIASYQTHAGQLLGTPLYMAPEQIAGALPDERSEVFSVGVLAHEILAGKPPYTATTMDALFAQITDAPVPPLPGVPDATSAIVLRALAKDPAARWPTMTALRDAIAAERHRRFAPRARRWPLAAALLVAAAGIGIAAWRASPARAPASPAPTAAQPGDEYVQRALDEYDLFYKDKAISSLRAAVRVAPEHPRANAYLLLFDGASDADRATARAAARRARSGVAPESKDRALLDAALALADQGAEPARAALAAAGARRDRELAFWAAELAYRAGDYAAARDAYRALLADPAPNLRGRIYDHYSSVLLYVDEPVEALRIGTLYRDAFPGEADAIGVYATTLAAAGQHAAAIAAAEEALRLSEGEDTLAGLAKVLALAGDHARARDLYARSLDRAGPARRPVRRAALALLQWLGDDLAAARATVAPCLPGGADATARERGQCLFVAGVIDPANAEAIARELDALAAAATAAQPAYGAPASLAKLVRARAAFFGGACLRDIVEGTPSAALAAAYAAPLDFYAAYHLPYFTTWQRCEQAAAHAAAGDPTAAKALLEPVAARFPWVATTLAAYR